MAALGLVRDSWGLERKDHGEQLAERAYAAKFAFVSGSPGYIGDLYVVTGDGLSASPIVLTRGRSGSLQVAEF
jgi:hypothetical protein